MKAGVWTGGCLWTVVCVMRYLSPSVGWEATGTLTLTKTFGAAFVVGLCISGLQGNRTN